MPEQASLHQRLVSAIVHDSSQVPGLAQAQSEALLPVYHQLRQVAAEGVAATKFLEGARAAVQAMERYMAALRSAAIVPNMTELTESYAFLIQAQQALKEAHDQAEFQLPLPPRPVPQNLVDLQGLVVGWMEGLVVREEVVEACQALIAVYESSYAQLANADAIASAWEPEQVEELGNLMRELETGYLGGIEALRNLEVLLQADAVRMVWPRLYDSFRLLQQTHRAIEELEERMGPIEFLETVRIKSW